MAKLNFLNKFFNAGPLILLYYLSISEIDTNLEKVPELAIVFPIGVPGVKIPSLPDAKIVTSFSNT